MTRFRRWRAGDGILRVIASGLRSTRGEGSTAARVHQHGDRFRASVPVGIDGDWFVVASGNSETWCAEAAELWLAQNVVGCWPHGGVVIENTREVQVFEHAMASVNAARTLHAA